jgi:hypothetical protein
MCTSGGSGGGGAIVGIIFGGCFLIGAGWYAWKKVIKPKCFPEMELVEVMEHEGKVEEVMVDAGEHTVS